MPSKRLERRRRGSVRQATGLVLAVVLAGIVAVPVDNGVHDRLDVRVAGGALPALARSHSGAPRLLPAAVVEDHVVRRHVDGGGVPVRLAVVRVDDRPVERREHRHADVLLAKASYVGVVTAVAVIRRRRARADSGRTMPFPCAVLAG